MQQLKVTSKRMENKEIRICFICEDNAFLSPLAEVIMKKLMADSGKHIVVSSAGLPGKTCTQRDKIMIEIAHELGYEVNPEPMVADRSLIERQDYIICFKQSMKYASILPMVEYKYGGKIELFEFLVQGRILDTMNPMIRLRPIREIIAKHVVLGCKRIAKKILETPIMVNIGNKCLDEKYLLTHSTDIGEGMASIRIGDKGEAIYNKETKKVRLILSEDGHILVKDKEIDFIAIKIGCPHFTGDKYVKYRFGRYDDFHGGVCAFSWTIYPEGRYFADEDGFGAEDNEEEVAYCIINRNLEIIVPFQPLANVKQVLRENMGATS